MSRPDINREAITAPIAAGAVNLKPQMENV